MVKHRFCISLVLAALSALLLWSVASGGELPGTKTRSKSLGKVAGNPEYQILNINNITTWTRFDGESNHSPGGDNGVYYPVGTGNVVYEDGFVWGGKVYLDAAKTRVPTVQPIRVEGSTYSASGFVGLKGGAVSGFGATAVAQNPNDDDVRCFRIRRDYFFMNDAELTYDAQTTNELASPSAVTQSMKDRIYQQYDVDWKNWPVAKGAPYIERNGTPGYQPPPAFSAAFTPDNLISGNYDEPGVAGADPGSPADQVIWNVYNDLDGSQSVEFTGSQPSGMEIQKTVWGYKRNDAMGNIYFSRYRMINKGGVDIGGGVKGSYWLDSVYVCQWSDIDLGNSGDDLVGSDSTMSIAYTYNGNPVDNTFVKFNLPPPSSGYDFLAGPEVSSPGDSAIFNFRYVKGRKNLPMSSFVYFSAGSPYSDPFGPTDSRGSGYSSCAFQWYAMLRGYAPAGIFGNDLSRYAVPPDVDPDTKYMMSGDPITQTGFVDGKGTNYSFAPGDRRMLLNSGPFSIAPGDTQEVYLGFVVGLGADRLSSVSVMKFNDKFVQNTFDALFQVPKPPPAPKLSIAEMNQKVIIDWGDVSNVTNIEQRFSEPGHYRFEGYNVYQLPSANSSLADGRRLATYDTQQDPAVVTDLQPVSGVVVSVPVQFGTNSGIQRQFEFKEDKVKDIQQIFNGQEYYIAVTAYSVATVPGFLPNALESPPIIYTVVPKTAPFGTEFLTAYGDTLPVTKAGASDGFVVPRVVNPTISTGHTYRVNFDTAGGVNTWKLTDVTTNKVVLANQTNQNADVLSPVVDGIQVRVSGAPDDVKDFLHVKNPTGPLNPPTYVGFSSFNSMGFPDPNPNSAGAAIADYGDGGRWGIHTGGASSDITYEDRFKPRTFRTDVGGDNFTRFVPYDFEIRFTAAGGKAWLGYSSGQIIDVPFELWNIGINTPDDPSDDIRMIPWVNDEDGSGVFQLMARDHGCSGGDNDPYTSWIYWMDPSPKTPGSAGYNAFVAAGAAYDGSQGTGDEVMARMVLVNINGGSISAPNWPANANSRMPATGNVIRILSTKPNSPGVSFTFTAPAPVQNADLAKVTMNKITVFPNPYYCINASETNRFNKYIQFTNMPQTATIRIFNLAGHLVRVLRKSDSSTFFKWDLANESNYPVASGMYIAYIEVPDVGSKVVKIAVIQEQELLDLY